MEMYHKNLRRSKTVNEFMCNKSNSIANFFNDNFLVTSDTSQNLANNDNTFLKTNITDDRGKNEPEDVNLWPNCDTSVWMRSCESEVIDPINGKVTGTIPAWLNGILLRNGPGNLKVGEYTYEHLFDSSALLHRFEISNGNVTYQNRFVQTDVYKRNQAAKRITMTEFGTRAVPDPCQTIFGRIASAFYPGDTMSDNSMISVYPYGDEYYTFTEVPIMHRIDPKTLETLGKCITTHGQKGGFPGGWDIKTEALYRTRQSIQLSGHESYTIFLNSWPKVNMTEYVGIVNHSSHPHVMNDGTVYNLGMSITPRGPMYNIVSFSPKRIAIDDSGEEVELSMFDQAKIVASVPSRWIVNPSYMHTFGITENYFVLIEQPLAVSLTAVLASKIRNVPMNASIKWHENEKTIIHVISRKTGKVERSFVAETFFFLHIINQFETRDGNYVVLDVCCYRDAKMLDCMYIEMMKNLHKNPDYPRMFRGRPLRFVMPMRRACADIPPEYNLIRIKAVNQSLEVLYNNKEPVVRECDNERINSEMRYPQEDAYLNDRTIERKADRDFRLRKKATAHRLPNGGIFLKPELLCDLGCETPRINSDSFLGKEYRYFYAISSDVDLENPGTVIKVDTVRKTWKTWSEENVYPSEAIFVPNPNGKEEDDGVVLCALVWGQNCEKKVGLLILDASSFTEIARSTFETPSPVPKCLHGWFTMAK